MCYAVRKENAIFFEFSLIRRQHNRLNVLALYMHSIMITFMAIFAQSVTLNLTQAFQINTILAINANL